MVIVRVGPIRCSPAVAGGMVYAGSDDGLMVALEARTGEALWKFQTGGPVQASPAIVGDVIVFGANDHNVYALNRRTGRKLWSFRTSGSFLKAPPVIHGNRVFAAQWADWVWCLNLENGAPLWKSFIPVSIEAVSYHQDRLWVRNPYWLVELDPTKGTWLRIAQASYGYGGMAFVGRRLFQSGIQGQYGTAGATSVFLDGEESPPPQEVRPTLQGVGMLKAQPLKGGLDLSSMATPLALDAGLVFATLSGKLVLTDLEGTPIWSHPLPRSCHAAPVAATGLLVVGCDDGYLYGFREGPR